MNFDNWKPRCHYLGHLMTPAKGKSNLQKYNEASQSWKIKFNEYKELENKETKTAAKLLESCSKLKSEKERLELIKHIPHLSVGCKTKLQEIYTKMTTGRTKFVKSKYFEKGLMVEEDCITAYSLFTGQFHKKNTEERENDYVAGIMDFECDNIVLDTKASWDIFTFDARRFDKIDPVYHWQLDGYMWLYYKDSARLVYCLVNTPEHLVRIEEKKLMYELFGSEANMLQADDYMKKVYDDECIALRKNHVFDDLPLKRKIKVFDVERDEARIDQIKLVVEGCRWYLNNIEDLNVDVIEEEDEVAA